MSKVTVNPWQKFKSLIPSDGRTYATVQAVGTNTCRVQLQNGDELIVTGTASQGDRVLIADGEIRQTVPALPFVNIELY